MKIKCQKCETIIEIEESEYPKGIEQTIECPLCENVISFTINEDINPGNSLPPSSPSAKVPKRVKSRKVNTGIALQSNDSMQDNRNEVVESNHFDEDTEKEVIEIKSHHRVKKVFVFGGVMTVCIIGLYLWYSQPRPSNSSDSDSIQGIVDSVYVNEEINESDSIITFLTSMYENSMYVSYPFLNRHCTKHLLTVLSEAYDYECDTTPCYATWLFRTSAQDEKSSTENETRLLTVREIGENWFEVEFLDDGWKGIKRIKAYYKDDIVVMDIVETVFDEAAENLKNVQEIVDSAEVSTNSIGYITALSERKLTERDLETLSTEQLELLRNMVFAWHGYKFDREDLSIFFSKYSWYRPTTTDAAYIYDNMSEIEKYNVDFIKSRE